VVLKNKAIGLLLSVFSIFAAVLLSLVLFFSPDEMLINLLAVPSLFAVSMSGFYLMLQRKKARDGGDFLASDDAYLLYELKKQYTRLDETVRDLVSPTEKYVLGSVKKIADSIVDDSSGLVLERLEQHVERTRSNFEFVGHFDVILSRFEREIDALGSRANFCMSAGITATLVVLSIAGYLIYSRPDEVSIVGFLPGVSALIIIEILSLFFLRQYKNCLDDIKYYNGECTKVELLKVSICSSAYMEEERRHEIAKMLFSYDAGLVLKGGATTVDIEKGKTDKEMYEVIKMMLKR